MNELVSKSTYSPEDNKLRVYVNDRLPREQYVQLKEAGFIWAPIQELFVAPKWTPEREDICLEFAGCILPEETSLVERAEAKADRLDTLAEKRAREAGLFHSAARQLMARFECGQPILVGHHSERKARKDREKIEKAMETATAKADAVNYWQYRAKSVEVHASAKSYVGQRTRRIKTLLEDLRSHQRPLNHAAICFSLWSKIASVDDEVKREKLARHYVGSHLATGPTSSFELYQAFSNGTVTFDEVIAKGIASAEATLNSRKLARWLDHTLNRLAYEQEELGPVQRYDGKLTATILKGFARTHGAHKPECVKDGGQWKLSSSVPLPVHLADGKTLRLSDEQWCELMEQAGYEVPEKAPSKPPILNFKAQSVTVEIWRGTQTFRQVEMTKKEYSDIYKDYRGVKPSSCGGFRVKVCKDPHHTGPHYKADWVAVFLSDSKAHPTPESNAVVVEAQGAA